MTEVANELRTPLRAVHDERRGDWRVLDADGAVLLCIPYGLTRTPAEAEALARMCVRGSGGDERLKAAVAELRQALAWLGIDRDARRLSPDTCAARKTRLVAAIAAAEAPAIPAGETGPRDARTFEELPPEEQAEVRAWNKN